LCLFTEVPLSGNKSISIKHSPFILEVQVGYVISIPT